MRVLRTFAVVVVSMSSLIGCNRARRIYVVPAETTTTAPSPFTPVPYINEGQRIEWTAPVGDSSIVVYVPSDLCKEKGSRMNETDRPPALLDASGKPITWIQLGPINSKPSAPVRCTIARNQTYPGPEKRKLFYYHVRVYKKTPENSHEGDALGGTRSGPFPDHVGSCGSCQ